MNMVSLLILIFSVTLCSEMINNFCREYTSFYDHTNYKRDLRRLIQYNLIELLKSRTEEFQLRMIDYGICAIILRYALLIIFATLTPCEQSI